jgi:4-hydroxy-3-polyprenylbenzoate decarboxylase
MKTVALALTGASGMPYGLRLLQYLLEHGDVRVWLLFSQAAQIVIRQETGETWPGRAAELETMLHQRHGVDSTRLRVFGREEWFAPVASGSNPADAMVICPCTMGTLAAVSTGLSDNLIERAADVMIKEGRKLILVPRETPFSAIHLEHMLKLARLGVCILPANPGFYHHPKKVDDLIDYIVARVLDQLDVPHELMQRWGASH